jgi:hypothetical protein
MSSRRAGTQSCGTILDIPICPHHQRPYGLLVMLLHINILLVFIRLCSTLAHAVCQLCPTTSSLAPGRGAAGFLHPLLLGNLLGLLRTSHLTFLTRGSSSATVRPGWAHSNVQRGRCVQHDDDDDGNHGGGGGGRGVAAMAATTTTLPCAPMPLFATRRRRHSLNHRTQTILTQSSNFVLYT